MANSKESKMAIRREIERLSEQRNISVREITVSQIRLDKLKGRRDKLTDAIDSLKVDIQ